MAEGIRKKIEKMKKEVEDANDKAGEAELGKKEALAYAEKVSVSASLLIIENNCRWNKKVMI